MSFTCEIKPSDQTLSIDNVLITCTECGAYVYDEQADIEDRIHVIISDAQVEEIRIECGRHQCQSKL